MALAQMENSPLSAAAPPPDCRTDHSIGIAGIKVVRAPDTVRTVLGSCIGVALYDRLDQCGDVCGIELPVGVDAHDQLGAVIDAVAKRGREGCADPPPRRMANHASSGLGGFLGGRVGAAVIHHENFDPRNSGDVPRNSLNDARDGFLFVECGNHDEQLEFFAGREYSARVGLH